MAPDETWSDREGRMWHLALPAGIDPAAVVAFGLAFAWMLVAFLC